MTVCGCSALSPLTIAECQQLNPPNGSNSNLVGQRAPSQTAETLLLHIVLRCIRQAGNAQFGTENMVQLELPDMEQQGS